MKIDFSRIVISSMFIIFGIGFGAIASEVNNHEQYTNLEPVNQCAAVIFEAPVDKVVLEEVLEDVATITEIENEPVEVEVAEVAYPEKPIEDLEMDAVMQGWVLDYATDQGVDPFIIFSICHHESRCVPDAVSYCGATGMMQIMPCWHQKEMDKLGVYDMYNPLQNIMVGIETLKNMINEGKGIEWALACYAGGPAYADAGCGSDYTQLLFETANYYRSICRR